MALPTQLIPISFNKGINNKSDDKQGMPGELLILENGVFKESGKINKRNGFDALTTVATSGTLSTGKALTSFNNELLAFTGTDVLGFSESENLWIGRGHDYSLSDRTTSIFSNDRQQQNPEGKLLNDLILYAWEDFPGGGVKYSLTDHLNGSVLISNAVVDVYGSRPKVIVFKNTFVIIYYNNGSLFARTVDPATPFTIADSVQLISLINNLSPQYDIISTGSKFYIGFSNGGGSLSTLSVFTSLTSHSDYNYTVQSNLCISLFDDGDNIWFVCGTNDGLGFVSLNVICVRRKSDNTDILNNLQLYKSAGVTPNYNIYRTCGYKNNVSGQVVIYYETIQDSGYTGFGNSDAQDHIISKVVVSTLGTIFSNQVFIRSIGLYGKPFNNGDQYFFCGVTNTEFQATYYIINEAGNVVTRSNVNTGGGYKQTALDGLPIGMCTDSFAGDGYGIFYLPLQVKTAVVSNNNTIYLPTGINVATYDFNADEIFGSLTLANNLNVCGPVSKVYDGFNFVENNFFQFPEAISVNNNNLIHSIVIPGTGDTAEVIQFAAASPWGAFRIPANSYITISSVSNNYYIWFRKDGVGTDPAPGFGVGVVVDINSDFSGLAVFQAIANALPVGEFTATFNATSITITNKLIGPEHITPPTSGTINSGNVAPGTYLYNAIYEWIDLQGQIHKSGSAVPLSVTTGAGGSVSIIVPTLKLTDKKNVKIVIYRTENLGDTIFYRVSDLLPPVVSNKNVDYVSFIDTASDEEMHSNDVLYTLGGVLDNSAPPSSTMRALYKNRMFLGGLDDPNLLWYSKIVTLGQPVQFSEYLTFKCDPKFGDITAISTMDDKLVIFKEDGIFILTGTGPDDTGAGDDFANGFQLIATDVGCIDEKSVVLTPLGLMFKSKKGIYLLGRNVQTSYIGGPVQDFNDLAITSAVLNPVDNQVRFGTNDNTMIVYNYFFNQWSTFTGLQGVDATSISSQYYLLRENGVVYKENPNIFTDNGAFIKLKLQTNWLNFAGMQGFKRIRRMLILGSYYGPHLLNTSFAYNFNQYPPQFTTIDAGTLIGENSTWGSDATWGSGALWGGSFVPYEWRIHLTQQKCTSIQITIEDDQTSEFNEGFDISAITFEAAVKTGANKLGPANTFGNRT